MLYESYGNRIKSACLMYLMKLQLNYVQGISTVVLCKLELLSLFLLSPSTIRTELALFSRRGNQISIISIKNIHKCTYKVVSTIPRIVSVLESPVMYTLQ